MAVLKTTLFILMRVSLSYKTGRKGITQAKRDYETKNKSEQVLNVATIHLQA
jgi:hypothetical protein